MRLATIIAAGSLWLGAALPRPLAAAEAQERAARPLTASASTLGRDPAAVARLDLGAAVSAVPVVAPRWPSEARDGLLMGLGPDSPPSTEEQLPPLIVTQPSPAPTLYVAAPPSGSLHELVGPNRQPVWTTQRRFPTTRAYVIAPWQVEFESWWEGKFKKDGSERHRFLEELEIGLPGRLQLDFYWRIQAETGAETRTSDFQLEARWALAPWNCLPLNPTLYVEYITQEGEAPEAWEGKLLLAADIGRRWQWAFNLFYERQTSGDEEIEMGFAQGISYALIDPCLTLGVEMKVERTTAKGSRDDPEVEVLLGPSVQWHPSRNVHLDVAPLFGLTADSPDLQVWVVLGVDLWPGTSGPSISAPSSTRGR